MFNLWTWVWVAGLALSVRVDDDLTFHTVTLATPAAPKTIDMCFNGLKANSTIDTLNVHLTCRKHNDSNEYTEESTGVRQYSSVYCSAHDITKGKITSPLNFECELVVNNTAEAKIHYGGVTFTVPESLPNCDSASYLKDVEGVYMVRMDCTNSLDVNYLVQHIQDNDPKESIVTSKKSTNANVTYFLIDKAPGNTLPAGLDDTLVCVPANDTKLCTETTNYIGEATKEDLNATAITVVYGGDLTVSFEDSPKYDLLAWEDSSADKFVVQSNSNSSASCSAKITGYTSNNKLNFAVVYEATAGDATAVNYQVGSVPGYGLIGAKVSDKTIEAHWIQRGCKAYTLTLNASGSIGEADFSSTTVHCPLDDDICYGYFTGVKTGTYTVSITPKPATPKTATPSTTITSVSFEVSSTRQQVLQVKKIHLDWKTEGMTVDAGVCFQQTDAAVDASDLTQYQLVLIDAQGRWRRARGASQKKEDLLCFSGVTLDSRQFNVVDNVVVVVTKRGVDGRTVLTSGESEVFFISPVVEGITARTARVTWRNPGGYTLTVRKKGHPAPLTTSTQPTFIHYFSRTSEDKLVVDTEDSKVKITAEVPLNPSTDKDNVTIVTMNEVILGTSFQICCEDDLTSYKLAELTYINDEDPVTEDTIKGTKIQSNCSTFEDLSQKLTDNHTVFELRLYTDVDGTQQTGRGSIEFTKPDLSNFPQCTAANIVGDKNMLRLTCLSEIQPEDFISIGNNNPVEIDGKSAFETQIQYLLLKDPITTTGKLKVYRNISNVIVNDGEVTGTVMVSRDTVDITDATTTKPTPTSIELEYEPTQTTVEGTSGAESDKFDVVNYRGNTVQACLSLDPSTLTCSLTEYEPGPHEVNILVVGYKNDTPDTMLESKVNTLQDFGIDGSYITSKTIEMKWTIQDGKFKYFATLSDPKFTEPPFTTAEVTCNDGDIHCYVYFLQLESKPYIVTIQPLKDDDTPDPLNKIVSKAVPPSSLEMATIDSLMDLPTKLTINYMTFPLQLNPTGQSVKTVINVICDKAIPSATDVTLSFIVYDESDNIAHTYVDSVEVKGVTEASKDYTFPKMQDNGLVAGKVTVMVVAHDVTSAAVAAGYATVTLEDIKPKVVRVGQIDDTNFEAFRITYNKTSEGKVQLDYEPSCECDESPCYCLDNKRTPSDPSPLCQELKCTDQQEDSLMHCDDQIKATESKEKPSITGITMTYPSESSKTVKLLVNADFKDVKSVEVVFYDPADGTTINKPTVTCNDLSSNNCQVPEAPVKDKVTDYKLLVVSTKDNDVIQSSINYFEDYKINVDQLTTDSCKVQFATKTKQEYTISIPESEGFNHIDYQCGGSDVADMCSVYFVSMKAGSKTVSVQKKTEGNLNVVELNFNVQESEPSFPTPTFVINKVTEIPSTTASGESNVKATSHTVSVTVKAKKGVTDISSVTLVIIKVNGDEGIEDLLTSDETENVNKEEVKDYTFTVPGDDVALSEMSYMLIEAKHAPGDSSDVGEASITLEAIQFPEVTLVGAQTGNDASLRVNTQEMPLTVNGNRYDANTTKYRIQAKNVNDPVNLCREDVGTNTQYPDEKLDQCDNTQPMEKFTPMSKPQTVLLTYQQSDRTATLSVTTTYTAPTSSVEVVKYTSSDSDVFKDPKTCAVTPSRRSTAGDETECTTAPFTIPEEEIDLVLLVVGVTTESKVQESVVVDFEDYKTTVQQLTADAFEVRFKAKENALYTINVTPNGGAYDTSTVQCGAEDNKKCNVYFISVTAGSPYIASVKKDGPDSDKNVVAASFNMESKPKPSRNATLTLRTHVLEVCVDGDVTTASTYNLVIIDMVGKTSSTTQTLNNKCFSEISLSVNMNQQLRILAYTDDKKRTVVLETDVYLLDMSETLQMTQIGGKAIKASWTNNNNGDVTYTIDLDSQNTTSQVPCKAGHRCLTYLHLNDEKDNWLIDVTENNQGTVQKMQVNVATVDIPDLSLKAHSIQWDDRLKVCFPKVEGAARYELGLQKGPVYLETTPKARVETQTDGDVCVFSSDKVDVGAYINLWMLVTAFNHDGGIVASGESTWNDIFLSVDRTVHAAIKEKHIITSWYLLEDASTIDSFHVTFRSADNTTINSYFASTSSSSHTFVMPKPGKYTACVVAQKSLPKINSVEVCSNIIQVSSNNDVDVPKVSGDKPKTTADDAVLVTWQPPQETVKEVSGFYVNWTKTYSKSTVVERLSPSSLVRLHRTQSDKLQDDSKGFIIVPASDTSVQIDGLDENGKYSFCISAVMDSVVGQPDCKTSDLSSYKELDAPIDLKVSSKGVVNWSSSMLEPNFLVEWTPDGEGKQGHTQAKGETSYTLSCSPGNWKVSVRTVSDESYSDPATVDATLTGIDQVPEQVGESSIKVSWWELPPPKTNQNYTISVYQNNELKRSLPHICSGQKTVDDCSVVFENLVARVVDPVPYEINIKSSDNTTFKSNFRIKPISRVTSLTQTIKSSDKVVVGWQQVDGAQFYILSLYSDETLTDIRVEHKVTLPTSFTLTEDNMIGNVVTIQACVDDNHCGDPLKITINVPVSPSENNSVIAVSVLGGILGIALVVYIVGAVVMSQKKKRGLKKAIERQQEKVIEMSPPPQPLYNEWGARRLGTRPTAPPRPLANPLP